MNTAEAKRLTFATKGLDPSQAIKGEPSFFGPFEAEAESTGEFTERLLSMADHVGTVAAAQLATSIHTPGVANVFHPDLSPGGSSGGSAVAVAEGRADLAAGTDAGGSIRIPAALAGLFALKPTHGLMPTEHNNWNGLSTNGIIAKDIPTTEKTYRRLTRGGHFDNSSSAEPKDIRVLGGIYGDSDLHPANLDALNEARQKLDYYGHRVVGDTDERIDSEIERMFPKSTLGEAYTIVMAVNVAKIIDDAENKTGKKATRDVLTASNWALREMGKDYKRQYGDAQDVITRFGDAFIKMIDGSVLLLPTLENPTPTAADMEPARAVIAGAVGVSAVSKVLGSNFALNKWLGTARTAGVNVPFTTAVANMARLPAATNPVSTTTYKGTQVPVGVQTISGTGKDAVLLGLGHQLSS